jgi:putative transposase
MGPGETRNESREKKGEAAIWQRRFWEHTLRDQEDHDRHVDYIHYNPVKHGLVENMRDWPWSSFHRYVKMGYYPDEKKDMIVQEVNDMSCGE